MTRPSASVNATAILLLAVLASLSACALEKSTTIPASALVRDGWITGSPKWYPETSSYRPVSEGNVVREQIVVIPESTRERAIQLLLDVPIRRLDQRTSAALLPDGLPNADDLVQKAVGRFEGEAAQRERQSKLDAFKNNPSFAQWAAEWRAAAEREKKLKGRLKPYLVRAVWINERTGGFTVWSHADELWVKHWSLGAADDHKAPVVIFLEHEPKALYVDAGYTL